MTQPTADTPLTALNQDEVNTIVVGMLNVNDEPVTEDKLVEAVHWIDEAKFQSSIVELVLDGRVAIKDVDDEGEPLFVATTESVDG